MLQTTQLLQLQQQSPDGVIAFDSGRWNQYAAAKRRSYTLMVFCSALHLQVRAPLL